MTKYIALLVSAVLVAIDQLTKWLAVNYMELYERIVLVSISDYELLSFFRIEPNEGAAFGIFQGQQTFLITVTSLFLVGAIIYMVSKLPKSNMFIWAWALVIAGGIGNLIDRIMYGAVTDFIKFFFMGNTIVNFADICAVLGALLLIITVFRDEYILKKKKKV